MMSLDRERGKIIILGKAAIEIASLNGAFGRANNVINLGILIV